MNRHCQARLRRRYGTTPAGWPDWITPTCGQSVGLPYVWIDLLGRERAACHLAGHLGDVVAQAASDELAERVRHETCPEPRAQVYSPRDMVAIRPEMVRDLR